MLWKEEKKQELTNRKKEETMGKVFGYPEFDENGEQILTTYDNEYKDMLMDVRVYRMKAGDEKSFQKTGEETAVLLLSGSIEFAFDDVTAKADRKDVFTEGPWCVHVATESKVSVKALARCSMGIFFCWQIWKCGKTPCKYDL